MKLTNVAEMGSQELLDLLDRKDVAERLKVRQQTLLEREARLHRRWRREAGVRAFEQAVHQSGGSLRTTGLQRRLTQLARDLERADALDLAAVA